MLKIEHLNLSFGGLKATNDISMCVKPNQITALIGPNGAGKTTLFNQITGVYKPDSGTITFNGKQIQGLKPFKITASGISRTYQIINLFKSMPVIENVLVGMHTSLKTGFWRAVFRTKKQKLEEKAAYEKSVELLKFVGLEDYANVPAGTLSYGQQRLLEIVRAMASDPKLILLDEPAAGMNSAEKEDLNVLVRKIIDRGITVLIVEHDMKLIMDIADEIYVITYGTNLANGTPEEIQNNPEVIKAYLGGDE